MHLVSPPYTTLYRTQKVPLHLLNHIWIAHCTSYAFLLSQIFLGLLMDDLKTDPHNAELYPSRIALFPP